MKKMIGVQIKRHKTHFEKKEKIFFVNSMQVFPEKNFGVIWGHVTPDDPKLERG